jgi:o-succinylbenzoate---CoA ligase
VDPREVINHGFWDGPEPQVAGDFPGDPAGLAKIPGLAGQVLFETSGSTGQPKWLALSKAALLGSAAAVNTHLGVNAGSRWGLALPMRHVGGFGVAARAWQAGCGLEWMDHRWDPLWFRTWLDARGVTHSSLVPTQVHDLVAASLRAPACLQAVVVGGGHLDEALGQAARALGWPVLASYGMTEAASQIATQSPLDLDSPFRPAPIPLLPIWRARTTADGLLRISGPALFSGTLGWNGSGWTYQERTGEWWPTQDRVELVADGLTPLGRADALVKVLGELVDPGGIERELLGLSGGWLRPDGFVVLAVPDDRTGHALVPVFDASIHAGAISNLLADYRQRAPGFLRLREPRLLDDFPRSPLGKPLRAEILRKIAGDPRS